MDEGKMLIVNIGEQGFTKCLYGEKGAVRETKHFPPNVPVECSAEMATILLKKHNDPTKKIIMRSAEGFALSDNPVLPIVETQEDGPIEPVTPADPVVPKRRGRPAKKK